MTTILADERKKAAAEGVRRAFLMRWRWRIPFALLGVLAIATVLAAFRLEPARVSYRVANFCKMVAAAIPLPDFMAAGAQTPPKPDAGRAAPSSKSDDGRAAPNARPAANRVK